MSPLQCRLAFSTRNKNAKHQTGRLIKMSRIEDKLSLGELAGESGSGGDLKQQALTRDDPIDVALRLYRAMLIRYPDRLITLCDSRGLLLARGDH